MTIVPGIHTALDTIHGDIFSVLGTAGHAAYGRKGALRLVTTNFDRIFE